MMIFGQSGKNSWKAILEKTGVGSSNIYKIDITTLEDDVRRAVEKDWDLIYGKGIICPSKNGQLNSAIGPLEREQELATYLKTG